MSEYYLVRFHTNCEECGKRFSGVFWALVPDSEAAPISGVMTTGMKAAAEHVDARNTKKGLDKRLRNKQWSELSSNGIGRGVCYSTPYAHFCPHCGARQSWDTMNKPKEPEKTSGSLFYIIAGAVLLGIGGMLIGLFAMAITLEHDPFFICLALGVILGALAGRSIGRSINQEEIQTYEKRLEEYRHECENYESFQQSLAKRTVHNEPIPEFETGCFGPEIPFPEDIGKYHPKGCPSCGRLIEGSVRLNSVEAARAAAGKCPWCGATLPGNRRVTLG